MHQNIESESIIYFYKIEEKWCAFGEMVYEFIDIMANSIDIQCQEKRWQDDTAISVSLTEQDMKSLIQSKPHAHISDTLIVVMI